jgi:hypothetical protein
VRAPHRLTWQPPWRERLPSEQPRSRQIPGYRPHSPSPSMRRFRCDSLLRGTRIGGTSSTRISLATVQYYTKEDSRPDSAPDAWQVRCSTRPVVRARFAGPFLAIS